MVFACVLTGLIKALRFAKGTVHDFRMYKEKGFEVCPKIKILADSGFQGIAKEHPNSITPNKRSKNKPLTDLQKKENKDQAAKRVIVEHVNREFKIFRICGCRYRGKHVNYEENWTLLAAIINLKKSTRNLKFVTL